MTSELRRRLLITLAALAGAGLLCYVPLPGVHVPTDALAYGADPAFASAYWHFLGRASLGRWAIQNYLMGSMLATLFMFLRAPGPAASETRPLPPWIPSEPRLTLAVALVFSAATAFGHAMWLEKLSELGVTVVAHPGTMFRLSACVTRMAATMLTIGLAWLVSSRGIGNGALVMMGAGTVLDTVVDPIQRASSHVAEHGPTEVAVLVALVVVWIVLATRWLSLRWTLGEPVAAGEQADDSPAVVVPSFHVSGVGVAGVALYDRFLRLVAGSAIFLPAGVRFGHWLGRSSDDDPLHAVLFVLLGAGATYVLTAWAYDAAIVRRALASWPYLAGRWASLVDDESYDRRLSRVAMLPAFSVPLACVLYRFVASKATGSWPSPVSLFVLVAIVLDASRQWRLHRSMALAASPGEHDAICGRCGGPVSSTDPFCAACGIVTHDEATCADHPLAPAVARCVVCQRALCDDCTRLTEERAVCEAHARVKLVEGWAVVEEPATELEAEVIQASLRSRQIEAVVLANTSGPAHGSLGVFQVLPAVPLLPHSRCGGGGIGVLVRTTDWVAATAAQPVVPEPVA